MKWTIWTSTGPLPPGQATKAQGYSRMGSDLKTLVPIVFVYLDDGWNADKNYGTLLFNQTWDWHWGKRATSGRVAPGVVGLPGVRMEKLRRVHRAPARLIGGVGEGVPTTPPNWGGVCWL